MGVTRTNGIPGLPGNNNFKVMKAGADALGYKECHTGRMAINSQNPDDERHVHCHQVGFCFQGCKFGAKWSTLYTEIPARARRPANLRCAPTAQVLMIEHDDAGKVTGVVYADAEGNQHRQKARVGLRRRRTPSNRPRLLLNSASNMFPDGLANSSGQVGQATTCGT